MDGTDKTGHVVSIDRATTAVVGDGGAASSNQLVYDNANGIFRFSGMLLYIVDTPLHKMHITMPRHGFMFNLVTILLFSRTLLSLFLIICNFLRMEFFITSLCGKTL